MLNNATIKKRYQLPHIVLAMTSPSLPLEKIILAQPRGFCAGVERAIDIVERALALYGPPIYVKHEIVHNQTVVEGLKAKGVIFVDTIKEVPTGSLTIFSAHGVSKAVEDEAGSRQLTVIDATCPLVTKVHKEAIRSESEKRKIILIGHRGHPEVEGTSGRVESDVCLVESVADVAALDLDRTERVAYITQTTLSVDDTKDVIAALTDRFDDITGPGLKDICYATQNRQNAVRELSALCDVMLVVGSHNSSNSNRLRDLAQECKTPSYLIDDASMISLEWLEEARTIGITAGASAPEKVVQDVVAYLTSHSNASVETMDGIEETIRFKLPKAVLGDPS